MLIQDQFGIIQNLPTSPIPQTSFLVRTFFAASYSKTALVNICSVYIMILLFRTPQLFLLSYMCWLVLLGLPGWCGLLCLVWQVQSYFPKLNQNLFVLRQVKSRNSIIKQLEIVVNAWLHSAEGEESLKLQLFIQWTKTSYETSFASILFDFAL